MSKPSLPRGVRDFGPDVMIKRNFIINTVRSVFEKFGFAPIETPTMENLSVLTGKYGDEGDQLLFKVLNSGDFLKKATPHDFESGAKAMLPKVAEKGLRYDLTVPFARFVVMNRHDLPMPFKRYQIQPVWRADRPQRGRYREFYQCDADVVGTNSLICEAEIVLMLNEIFAGLNIQNFTIKINNRKILTGIAEIIGAAGRESELCVAIDKLDKIGQEKVEEELQTRGFSSENISNLQPLFTNKTFGSERFEWLTEWLSGSEIGTRGVEELKEVWSMVKAFGLENANIELDATLARGLSYYTGAIFEVKANDVQIGSISGGGRYDDLTGTFGVKDLSGVGISLGIDRIFDVMEELESFPENQQITTQILIVNFDETTQKACLPVLKKIRDEGINAELYPDFAKMKKQFDFANKKNIPYVLIIGSEELNAGKFTLKNMATGEQQEYNFEEIIDKILKG
ncbi:MAG: histidyl-tRNA synthetase [Spirosomataceae bacterium]|jgi:histidyl-tRNA synthetase